MSCADDIRLGGIGVRSAAARGARRRGALLAEPPPVSRLAEDVVVAGVPVRTFTPSEIDGVYLHLHGGGFVYGSARLQDDRLERLALACRALVVSVEYRPAPEHPYPAGPDDCEAVALHFARGEARPVAIAGESAGANLAVATLIRLWDRHGFTGFRAAALTCGVFDLELPQFADGGDQSLTKDELTRLIADYAAGSPPASPDVSPAHASGASHGDTFTLMRVQVLLDPLPQRQRYRTTAGHQTGQLDLKRPLRLSPAAESADLQPR